MYLLHQLQVCRDQRDILSIDQLSLPTDKITVLMGHNGSGKSTLMSLLANQSVADNGSILLNGHNLKLFRRRQLAKRVAYMPQHHPQASGLNVKELVMLGRYPWRGIFGRYSGIDHDVANEAMELTQVTGFATRSVESLSGGERQRAWLAMLLAQEAPLLLLDEPTSALDIEHQYKFMELIKELNQKRKIGVIVILHDLNLALRYAEHFVVMNGGKVVYNGSRKALQFEDRLASLFSVPLKFVKHPNLEHPVAIVC